MKRLLIVSVLDFRKQKNNREHQLVRYYSGRFPEVTLLYKRRNLRGSLGGMLWDILVPSSSVFKHDGCRFIETNPPLNHYQGMARELSGADDITTHGGGGAGRLMFWAMSALGLLKDLVQTPVMILLALPRLQGRYDACLALGPWGNAVAFVLRRLGRVRCWVYVDRDYEPGFLVPRFRRRFAAALEHGLLRRADLVLSIGRRLARLRRRQSGRPVALSPTGVNLARFAAARNKVPHPPTLVFTGNLEFWSGLELVLAAFPELHETIPDLRLLVVGGAIASYERRLHQQVKDLDVEDAVHFFGPQEPSAIPEIFREADIGLAFFKPTAVRRYAAPLKVFEYLAAGLPVITTPGTETADLLREAGAGCAVPYSPAAFAAAVRDILGDGRAYREASRAAMEFSERFDWKRLLDEEYRLIREAHDRLGR